jgi:hypothetical protein
MGKAKTETFFLPKEVIKHIKEGKDLAKQTILFLKELIQNRVMEQLVF